MAWWSGSSTGWSGTHGDFERFEEIRAGRGALLAAVHEPIDTSTEIGVMVVRLLVSFARLESANNSLRTSAAMAESAKLGRLPGGGWRPSDTGGCLRSARTARSSSTRPWP